MCWIFLAWSGLDCTRIRRQVSGVDRRLRSQLSLSWYPGRERERGGRGVDVQLQPDAAFNLICKTRGQTMTRLCAWACSLSRSAQAAQPLETYTVLTQCSVFAALLVKTSLWDFSFSSLKGDGRLSVAANKNKRFFRFNWRFHAVAMSRAG